MRRRSQSRRPLTLQRRGAGTAGDHGLGGWQGDHDTAQARRGADLIFRVGYPGRTADDDPAYSAARQRATQRPEPSSRPPLLVQPSAAAL